MVKKFFLAIPLLLLLLFIMTFPARASMLMVGKNGEITWKVLSEQDNLDLDVPEHSSIEITKVAENNVDSKSLVELSKNGDKVSLYVLENGEEKKVDIANPNSSLIEIEERNEIQKVNIGIRDDKFSLQQKGIVALTEFPLKIDPITANLTVRTESGDRFLSVLPYQAVQTVLRSKLMSRINDNRLEIIEEERELQYSFSGEKVFNIYDFFEYTIPISVRVSATTGETVSVEGPSWYKIVGFFLS